MSNIKISIGDIAISNSPSDSIITYGLGSCIAIMMYHALSGTGCMAHIALYDCAIGKQMNKKNKPGYYANRAVQELFFLTKETYWTI